MFSLNGNKSVITCEVFPPLQMDEGEWEIGLVDLTTFNSIPNIETGLNDKFIYGGKEIIIDEGSYEISNIEAFILQYLKENDPTVSFSLKANNNTLKAEISCSEEIDFQATRTIGPMLGFSQLKLAANGKHVSDQPVDILRVSSVRVECNIVRGAFDNGREGHILHEFYLTVAPGYKVVEIPRTVIYLPLNVRTISNITVQLKDQNGKLVNFRGETISLRLHIRHSHGSDILRKRLHN